MFCQIRMSDRKNMTERVAPVKRRKGVGFRLSVTFFPGYSGFPHSRENNISKFQFHQDGGHD